MKTDKNFRLSKETKMMMENFTRKDQRNTYKEIMINAELTFSENRKKKFKTDKQVNEE